MATAKLYGRVYLSLASGEINLNTHVLKLMLCSPGYTPDQDAHRYKSDVTNEIVATGYTAGGNALGIAGSITLAYDSATNKVIIDGPDVVWPSSTITARWGVLYDSTPSTDATRPLIGYVDFGGLISSTTASFTVPWDPAGIVALTAA